MSQDVHAAYEKVNRDAGDARSFLRKHRRKSRSEETDLDEAAKENKQAAIRKKLRAAAYATQVAEEMIAGRLPSPEEWAQLLSRALGKVVPVDAAMRMQVELCDKWGMTATEAEWQR